MKRSYIHIGDVLRIREWDDMASEFGYKYGNDIDCDRVFTVGMKHLCGQKFTVKGLSGTDGFLSEEGIECNERPFGVWAISADMLEPYTEEGLVAEESPDSLFSWIMSTEETL